jgi:hypothetical protein
VKEKKKIDEFVSVEALDKSVPPEDQQPVAA